MISPALKDSIYKMLTYHINMFFVGNKVQIIDIFDKKETNL